jgi:pimeloyl-ACP methyl ester carboxylesterase
MTVELHVEESGAADVDGAPALVLLHAFPLDSRMWAPQRELLRSTCRVVTPDLRGFGASPLGDDEPSLDRMADDVVAVLDRLDLDRVVLGGLSMGGYVTMALLRRHAERVRAVVLADTKATADPPAARENRERIARTLLEERSSRVLVDDVLPTLLGEATKQERSDVVETVRALVESAPPAAAAWAQRAMAARPDSFDVLRDLAVPLLVLVGEEDTISPVADARAMAESAPRSRAEVIGGAGHLSAVETPVPFAERVRDFVAELA